MKKKLIDVFFEVEGNKPAPWHNLESAIQPAITAWEQRAGGKLNDDQVAALYTLSRSRVSFLCGGPGTGKTTVTGIFVDALKSRGIRVHIVAPTGRAAQRAAEVSGEDASTIHRAMLAGLDMKPRRGVLAPLQEGVVIIDEVSMMSRPLFSKLLTSFPARYSLVLSGDPDQLPPVGETPFLGPALDAQLAPTARLTKIMRQAEGSAIVRLAGHVREGRFPAIPDNLPDLSFVPASTIKECFRHLLRNAKPGDTILTPLNKGPLGVERVNKLMQRIYGKRNSPTSKNETYTFRLFDPVIQLENNYRIHAQGVFNGETGKIVRVTEEHTTVRFGRKTVRYGLSLIHI